MHPGRATSAARPREELELRLGHRFREPAWLERALTHRSAAAVDSAEAHNERLEFLGDAVLGLLVTESLLETFPEWSEGKLSKSRAQLVSAPALAAAAARLAIGDHLRLGAGEEKTGGREKQGLLADAYEAVVAAIYVDGGFEAASRFVRSTLLETALRESGATLGHSDHKSALQEWLQGLGAAPAVYRVARETGPDHRKVFFVEVIFGKRVLASAEGRTKKEAEQAAARLALETLRREGGSAGDNQEE